MSMLRNVAFAVAAFGFVAASSGAEAQYYYHPHYGYVQQQPQWVPPKVARKQEQLTERFIQKYGYQQPRYVQPGYGHGYGYGRPPRGYYHQPQPYGHVQPRHRYGHGGGYYQSW
jgi:hypothetical protein